MAEKPSEIYLKSPAKVNLNLLVDGRLDNGYHSIRSLICPIDLVDNIKLSVIPGADNKVILDLSFSDNFKAHYNNDLIGVEKKLVAENNLAVKAAKLFFSRAELDSKYCLRIDLLKNIPLQAGLGGGSSNAAYVLRGLNALLENVFSDELLFEMASDLGSDVTAFLAESLILAHGTGDEIGYLEKSFLNDFSSFLNKVYLILLKPSEGICTKTAYESFGFKKGSFLNEYPLKIGKIVNREEIDLIFSSITDNSRNVFLGDFSFLCNDFENFAREHSKEVDESFKLLTTSGASKCLLAGSGSSVIAFFESRDVHEKAFDFLKKEIPSEWYLQKIRFLI